MWLVLRTNLTPPKALLSLYQTAADFVRFSDDLPKQEIVSKC